VIRGSKLIDWQAIQAYQTAAHEACPNLVRGRHRRLHGMVMPGVLGRLRERVGTSATASP
jgi:AICAR transformylase/IMP cyclohydrolase PurH